jgi:rod shape-determining protein MreC
MRTVKAFLLKHRTGSLLTAYLVVSLILLSVTSDAVNIDLKKAGVTIVSVVQRGGAEVGRFFGRMVNSIGELRRLRENYESLQEQMHEYRVNEREIAEMRSENGRLRDQLDFSESLAGTYRSAEIIGMDAGDFLSGLLIDKGSVHGIEKNMPVVAYSGGFEALVGKIFQVGPVSSIVLPLFDPSCYVPGRMQSSRYTGLINGQGTRLDNLVMSSIPKSARGSLKVGDIVMTSGLSSIYPADLYVGRVTQIGAKPWDTSLVVNIEPAVEFSKLEYVFVLEAK